MTTINNPYLYNFILSSYFINYDHNYSVILGLDSALPLYLFNYSKDLFFTYPTTFETCSVVTDSDLFVNICYSLIHNFQPVEHIGYIDQILTFKYLHKFNFSIYNMNNDLYYKELYNNEYYTLPYNGLNFNIPKIEAVIAYCIHKYTIYNKDIKYLMDTLILSGIYKTRLVYNNVLINLLKLNINLKITLKSLIKDIKRLQELEIQNLPLQYSIIKQRSLELLEFCYG
jgi:hypothetical protein